MNNYDAYKRLGVIGAYGAILAVVLVYGCLAENPFSDPGSENFEGADDMHYKNEDGAVSPEEKRKKRCEQSCLRIEDCGLLPDVEMCMPWCEDEWTERIQDCIANAECDGIEDICFTKSEKEVCADLCEKLDACEWMAMDSDQCAEACLDEWTKSQRDCLAESDCERAPAHCLDLHIVTPCSQVCEKLKLCEFISRTESSECLDFCESEMDDPARDCVMRQECDEIETQCALERLPSELCLMACDTAIVCELATMSEGDCHWACEEEWDLELSICLAAQDNCEGAEKCLDIPGSQCVDICAHLIACAALDQWEYEMCLQTCPTEFSDMERECLSSSPCQDVDACLEAGAAVDDSASHECSSACATMAQCDLIETQSQLDCQQTCIESWSQLKRNCVAESGCEAIADQCLALEQGLDE
jgi:hypothetical protein